MGPSNTEIDTGKKNHLISIAVTKVSLLEYKRKTYKNGHQWVTYKEGKEQTSSFDYWGFEERYQNKGMRNNSIMLEESFPGLKKNMGFQTQSGY